jgi:hypothetical protein
MTTEARKRLTIEELEIAATKIRTLCNELGVDFLGGNDGAIFLFDTIPADSYEGRLRCGESIEYLSE